MSKHTPGPWRAGSSPSHIIAESDTGWDDEANLSAYGGHLICESVAREANAALIAAAPELLAACKLALKSWFSGEISERAMEMVLRDAIAKAEGPNPK